MTTRSGYSERSTVWRLTRAIGGSYARASGTAAPREWRGPESNRRHHGFQPCALPTELPRPAAASLATPRSSPPSGAELILPAVYALLNRRFRFAANGTTLRRDTLAGATTFIVMSYIIFVNP